MEKEHSPYGDDLGARIFYTKHTFISIGYKATTQVNKDADEGINMWKLRGSTNPFIKEV